MGLLSIFGIKKKASGSVRSRMPALNSFVTVAKAGTASSSQVTVEEIGAKTFATTLGTVGREPGTAAIFTYTSGTGKHRFRTRIVGSKGELVVYEMPGTIDRIGAAAAAGGSQKRSTVRLETTVPGQWRFSRNGKGYGSFSRANITDISRTGVSLIIDRELRKGTQVEVSLALNTGKATMLLLGEVMRVAPIAASGKHSHGLRFHGVAPADDKAIMDFINKRQAERRSRGLA
jgi:c-di-GMP-binding flagellar brake protein YcgR